MNEKEIESSKKDAIVNQAYEKINEYKTRGYAVERQSEDLKEWFEEQDEVESVSVYGETDITVKFKDDTKVGILLNRKQLYGGGKRKKSKKGYSASGSTRKGDPHPISLNAAIIDPLFDDWPPESTPDDIFTILTNAGYEVDYFKSDNVDLDFFSNVDEQEYGVVFIRSHGGMMDVDGESKLHIMVRPFFASFPPSSGYNGVEVFSVGTDVLPQGWAYTYAFNDQFVRQYLNNRHFPNTLFHLLVCHGADPLAENDMIKTFLNRGVGCYTGWTKNASPTHGDPAAVQFFQELCDTTANPTNTVEDAIDEIIASGHSTDPGTGADLVAHGADAMQIIDCSIVNEVSHITVRTPSGIIIRGGFHDILDAMEYSNNQIMSGKYSRLNITHNVELKKIKW